MIRCDVKLCVGCRICEITCATSHYGAVSPALSRIRVAKIEETGIELAIACLGCKEKPCLDCPTEALVTAESGEIVLDADLCAGCLDCVDACPIGAVGWYDSLPQFCDRCGGEISCVATCPTAALSDVEPGLSLAAFLDVSGNQAERRAYYAADIGGPLRQSWKAGARVDS